MIQRLVCSLHQLISYCYDIWESWSTIIFFLDRSEVRGIRFPTNSIPPEDPIIKDWEYGLIAYFLEIHNAKNPFFHCLSKFQKCMLKRIHHIFTSPDSPTKFPYNKSIDVEVHCTVIEYEYENGKVKPSHYLI